MNPQATSFLRRAALWSLLTYLVAFLFYAVYVAGQPQIWLSLPFYTTPGLLLFWLHAILSLQLQDRERQLQQQGQQQNDQLFDESYEWIILQRQKSLADRILRTGAALCFGLALIALVIVQWINPFEFPALSPKTSYGSLAFCLFLAALQFVLGRFLGGSESYGPEGAADHASSGTNLSDGPQTAKAWPITLRTLGGLLIYHALFTLIFGLQAFSAIETFQFLTPWLQKLGALAAALYLLELPLRLISSAYGRDREPGRALCPQWAFKPWNQKLREQAAQSFKYQFGYDLQSNLSRLLQSHGGPLIIVLFLCWMASDMITSVPFGHKGYLQHWGQYQKEPLAPGLHIKWPAPIQNIAIISQQRQKVLSLGGLEHGDSHLWDNPEHSDDDLLIVRTPKIQNDQWPIELVSVGATVSYNIAEPIAWLSHHHDARETLHALAKRELIQTHLTHDRDTLLESSRSEIENELKIELQKSCDQLQLGVHINGFSIPQMHPPASTVESFQEAVKADFQKQSTIAQAKGEAQSLLAKTESEKRIRLAQAQAQRAQILSAATAMLQRVKHSSQLHAVNPELYWQRQQLETLPKATAEMHKILLLSPHEQHVQTLNLEPTLEPELFDLQLETQP